MTLEVILVSALLALAAGLVVALVGFIFDKTMDNRYAWLAGGIVALIVFIAKLGIL